MITALDPHLSVGMSQQFGLALRGKRRYLLQLFTREIDLPRLEGFVETNLAQLHLFDTKEHMGTPGLSGRNFTSIASARGPGEIPSQRP